MSSKYHAIHTKVDGITFDSKDEAARYGALVLWQKSGEIADLDVHPSWRLHAVDLATGEITEVGIYRADFRYRVVATGAWVVEDVKGMRTLPLSKWKQKHLLGEYGIVVIEVRL